MFNTELRRFPGEVDKRIDIAVGVEFDEPFVDDPPLPPPPPPEDKDAGAESEAAIAASASWRCCSFALNEFDRNRPPPPTAAAEGLRAEFAGELEAAGDNNNDDNTEELGAVDELNEEESLFEVEVVDVVVVNGCGGDAFDSIRTLVFRDMI